MNKTNQWRATLSVIKGVTLMAMVVMPLCAVESPTTAIAAAVIRERAREAETRGQLMIAHQLRNLATGLSAGQVTLSDAALVVNIALAGNGPTSTPTTHETPVSAAQVTAILDGEATPLSNPQPPAPPLEKPDKEVVTDISTPVVATPEIIQQPEQKIPVATSVLTASRVGTEKTMLVMIGAGEDQQIKVGQRFIIKRNDEQIAVISATQVKPSMSICIAIAGTLADDAEIKAGDAVLSE